MLWREIVLLIFDDLSVIPSTASEALERNEMFYFTGKKCSKGHLSLRYASTKHCKMCSKIREKVRWADSKSRDKCLDKQRSGEVKTKIRSTRVDANGLLLKEVEISHID